MLKIRPATPEEAATLTELALRSKAHWGYDADFLRDCREDLTITPTYVQENPVYVAEDDGEIAGFYTLRRAQEDVELDFLYVEPAAIGKGCGRLLWRHAVEHARSLGFGRMLIHSDPHAENFYRAMGAERIGQVPSPVREGRMLPLLSYSLSSQ